MVTVALADAKARLSELVDRANAGEAVSITKRGKPVARLVPETPAGGAIDVEALRRVAKSMPYQAESAGDFFARVRADDSL
ncbi:MAG: type II toxin-antitoxin system prevent-host-death family antitoxin [Pseudomonadota bacterium]